MNPAVSFFCRVNKLPFFYATLSQAIYVCSLCQRHKKVPQAARDYSDALEYCGWGPVGDLLRTREISCRPNDDTPEMARAQLLPKVLLTMMMILVLVSYSLQACTTYKHANRKVKYGAKTACYP